MSIMTQRKVLVLNKGWNPIGVITLERAMALIWMEPVKGKVIEPPKARIMDPTQDFRTFDWNNPEKPDESWAHLIPRDDEPAIRSARASFRIPEIVVLQSYDKLPQQRIHFSRRTIYRRDGNKCQYCGRKPGTDELSIDHIVPRSRGGITSWTNCVLACVECNRYKADLSPKKKVVIEKKEVTDKHGEKKVKSVAVTYYTVSFFDGKKTWETTIKEPRKPKFTFYKCDYRCKTWEAILGVAYWEVELQNDMDD
jgi:5-methylcytosine-specific restriction endonuclease McrA